MESKFSRNFIPFAVVLYTFFMTFLYLTDVFSKKPFSMSSGRYSLS